MSYALVSGAGKAYVGNSGDDKPRVGRQLDGSTLTATDIGPLNTPLFDIDTGDVWRWDGTGAWVRSGRDDKVLAALVLISEQLTAIHRTLAIGFDVPEGSVADVPA